MEDFVGGRVGTKISVCLSVCREGQRGMDCYGMSERWRPRTKEEGWIVCWLSGSVCFSASCLWWNLGKDKTLGRCDGAAKWRIRMGVSAVAHVPRS